MVTEAKKRANKKYQENHKEDINQYKKNKFWTLKLDLNKKYKDAIVNGAKERGMSISGFIKMCVYKKMGG